MEQTLSLQNLTIHIRDLEDRVVYTFSGDIHENFQSKDIPKIQKPKIVFKLGGIENFNSCGIREWTFFMREMEKHGDIFFEECSVTMVDQFNMVPDTLSKAKVVSFYAPYYCECRDETNQLIPVDRYKLDLEKGKAPELKCDQCENTLEFDALEESYFMFLKKTFS